MKHFLVILTTLAIIFNLNCMISAQEVEKLVVLDSNANVDSDYYKNIMIECTVNGDVKKGKRAEILRNLKNAYNGISNKHISFDDLNWLSKIMDIEAGGCAEEFYWGVGEVVLNRVASPEFPNTIQEVLNQEGPQQYYGANSKRLAAHLPQKHVVEAAWRLLEGERHLIPTVVFHDNRIHGGGAYVSLYHEIYGPFYLSLTSYPELYEE